MLCSIAFKKNHLTTISTIKISSLSELGGLIQNHKKQEIAKPVPSEAKESHLYMEHKDEPEKRSTRQHQNPPF